MTLEPDRNSDRVPNNLPARMPFRPYPETDPSMDEDIDDLEELDPRLAGIVSALADRRPRGASIAILEECRRYPEFSNELKSLWGTIVVAEAVG
ncbi:MAG: hypothetical protein ACK5OC_03780, partial [Pirellula sp.]